MPKHNQVSKKEIKNKSNDDIITDILNIQIGKGNVTEDRVCKAHKHRVKASKPKKDEKKGSK